MPKPLVSICVPVFNEEANIRPLYARVGAVMASLDARYEFELLFTDNHSTDQTFEVIAEVAASDPRVRVLRFSRNFGFQKSIATNYRHARGAAAMQLDADLQDPPELMTRFLELWEQGYKVVYGVRRSRPEESRAMHGLRRLFYRLIDGLSEDHLPHDAGDFRLIDRVILDELKSIEDQQPYLRGTISAMGFRQIGVPYDRSARERGSSKFTLAKLIGLALDGILHHSTVPLRLASFVGFGVTTVALLGAGYYIVARLFFRSDWPVGLASSSILMLLSIGMNALLLGIMGEYIGRIYKNVKRMPFTIVEAVIDHRGARPTEAAQRESQAQ